MYHDPLSSTINYHHQEFQLLRGYREGPQDIYSPNIEGPIGSIEFIYLTEEGRMFYVSLAIVTLLNILVS